MKNSIKLLIVLALFFTLASCEKDEGKLPDIAFKTGSSYTSGDVTVAGGTTLTIGIEAEKTEEEDVLKTFNISKSENGGSNTTVYSETLSGSDVDMYDYDFTATVGATSGDTETYTFTVTNRDGLTNQVSLTVTIQ